jgi:hypothetical protein
MNPVPAAIKATREPQVNLLPPEVEARRARGRQRGLIGLAFFAFLLVLALGVYWASSQESSAKKDLQASVDEGARLQAKIDSYQYVLDIQGELNNARNARTFVGSTDLTYSEILRSISLDMPSGMGVDGMTWSISSVILLAPQSSGPFAEPDIGSISLHGRMDEYVSSADLEERLNSIPGLARARIETVQRQDEEGGQYYAFQGSVRITALAFTGRFGPEWLANQAILDATDALETRVTEAQAAVAAAEEALAAGEPGAAAARDEAMAAETLALNDREQFLALSRIVAAAEDEILAMEDAVARGDEGAEEALLDAQARIDELWLTFDPLIKAITAWDEEDGNLVMIEARFGAAEEYVADAQQGVTDAQVAVTEGEEGAEAALVDALSRLARAENSLAEEQSDLAAAEEAERTARAALDEALAAAAIIAPVGVATGEEES